MSTNTYVALATQTLGSAAASVTFSSIPATYTDLVLVVSGTVSADGAIRFRLNSDSATNYSGTLLYGSGTNAVSVRGTSETTGALGRLGTVVSTSIAQFMNYSNTTTNKTVISRGNSSNAFVTASVALWRNTAAISTMLLTPESAANFDAGSTFSLYGVAAEGMPNATGGYVISDANYYYHTFTASGTFTPLKTLSCDVLVVAGGGGGGSDYAGGGGAGGVLGFTSQSISTAQTVTIGAGGAGGANNSGNSGTQGANSTLGSLTTCVGGGYGAGAGMPRVGGNGGSGGGGASAGGGSAMVGGTATSGQGFAGGTSNPNSGAGGGGAGGAGANSVGGNNNGGAGGAGLNTWSTWLSATGLGVSGFIGGGGGGGGDATGGGGGSGGGGSGGTGTAGTAGTVNTGGGGGGGASAARAGGAGGSGLIIVRYAK